jgi:thioredoxin 1
MIVSITKHNFKHEIEEATKPVVIEVYATWCGPCQHMMPIFEKLEKEMGDKYVFAKLNVDESREVAIHYGITSVPTFLFIKHGKVIGKEVGFLEEADLKTKIEQLVGS